MEKKELTEDEILREIRKRFDTNPDAPELEVDMLQFLDERAKLAQSDASWSLASYVKHYEKLKGYGLDEKLMEDLEFFIRLHIEEDLEEFLKSEFYRKFSEHKIVARVVNEYE